jgi:glycosyltransferase involved in cell wall biosynthesis
MALRVNWFTPTRRRNYNRMAASIWLRCFQLLPYLAEQGVACTVNDRDADADVCVFVRWQDRDALDLARRQRQRGQRVVFDLVVNYFDEADVPYLGQVVTRRHMDEARKMVDAADAVCCGSSFIAERAGEYHGTVEYIPESIDRRHFTEAKSSDDFDKNTLTAIWSGWSNKARELEPVAPLLTERGIDLVLVTDRRPRFREARPGRRGRVRYRRWRYQSFPRQIVEGDVCLSHRNVDNPYNRGHSLFKIAVFMAEGVPALASPVPSYFELIGDGRGGRICRSRADWEQALDLIRSDRSVLRRWSEQAREAAVPFHTDQVVAKYVELFGRLAGGTTTPASRQMASGQTPAVADGADTG